jgi:hypothetical protein
MRCFSIIILLAMAAIPDSHAAADFSTPEGAVLAVEDAYRTGDIEKVIKCKDFTEEARYMFRDKPQIAKDPAIIAQTAEVLQLSFRTEMRKKGLPNFKGVTSTFPKKEGARDGRVILTEVCRFPDGKSTTQKLLVVKTPHGWRLVIPVS